MGRRDSAVVVGRDALVVLPVLTLVWLLGGACGESTAPRAPAHLREFGYALVDCGFDDPLDGVALTSYVNEVSGFTSFGMLCVFEPTDTIAARLAIMRQQGMKAMLNLQFLFFTDTPDTTRPGGLRTSLRPDYLARWRQFASATDLDQQQQDIAAIYLVDEPSRNALPAGDLQIVADLLEAQLPAIPTVVVEGYPDIAQLQVPSSVDWIGFDRYGVRDPARDAGYLAELEALKARRSNPAQRIILVMDASWWSDLEGAAGLTPADMAGVARSYYLLAAADTNVVALVGYLWPGGFDDPGQLGARELPAAVRDEHRRIGSMIIGR